MFRRTFFKSVLGLLASGGVSTLFAHAARIALPVEAKAVEGVVARLALASGVVGPAPAGAPLDDARATEAAASAPQAAKPGLAPARDRILLQVSPVAGFQYHAGESVWPFMRTGDAVNLAREPDNVHDPNAVRVEWGGHKLGYIPRVENTAVAQLLDRDEQLSARIASLAENPDPWERVELELHLHLS